VPQFKDWFSGPTSIGLGLIGLIGLSWTNTLAYLTGVSVMGKERFIVLKRGNHVIKILFLTYE
jgi:hypothetical protein